MMNDLDFDQLLRSARGVAPLPTTFRTQVWRRIEADANAMPLWRRRIDWWCEQLLRPSVATASVLATVVLGASLGLTARPDPVEAENHYLRSVSPFVERGR